MWFIFWLISLCKIFYVCLFVCLFALGLLKKSCLINLQMQDLSPTRLPAVAIGNTFNIVLLFLSFFLSCAIYIHINLSFPLTLRRRENWFVFYLQKRKTFLTVHYILHCAIRYCLCHHLSYPTFHTCMLGFIMKVRFLYCMKFFWRESQKNTLILTTQLGPLFSCSSFINGVELVKRAVETWTLHVHMLCVL